MNFTIELTAAPSLLEAVKILATALTGQQQPVNAISVKETSTKKTKALTTPATQVEEVAETAIEETAAEEAPMFTLEQVRAAAQAKSQSGKREEVRALVTELGAASLPNLAPSKFNDFMSKLEAL